MEQGTPLQPDRTWAQWKSLQESDPTLRRVLHFLQRGQHPNRLERQAESKEVLEILRQWDRLRCKDGVLCRTFQDPKEVDLRTQIVAPAAGNGGCERFNRTLLGLLGTLGEERRRWHDHLQEMIQVYNNTTHSATGYTPYYLLFGRHGSLPQDCLLGIPDETGCASVEDWVKCHQQRLRYAYEKAGKHTDIERTRQKRHYDHNAENSPLLPGERVMMRDMRARGRGKLADKWEVVPYIVEKQTNPELPVYVVRPEQGQGAEKVRGQMVMWREAGNDQTTTIQMSETGRDSSLTNLDDPPGLTLGFLQPNMETNNLYI
ncbi:uncharacterized protein LOC116224703 [Clupea harengus]|uniref:Uncharacterized protein LOC116224703 n=1 Tax=Clupea harengus TaxID=7950 RepID=A0A8M1KUW3_CLUHA|nr:uncharacterized protein LOC116224703 [Clupea harengus]